MRASGSPLSPQTLQQSADDLVDATLRKISCISPTSSEGTQALARTQPRVDGDPMAIGFDIDALQAEFSDA
jgi:hypothetical protein